MNNRKITLSELRKTMISAKAFVLKKVPLPAPISVPVSAWASSESGSFKFAASVTVANIKAADAGHVAFDEDSIETAMDATVITGSTTDGSIILRAQKKPAAKLTGICVIIRGAVE